MKFKLILLLITAVAILLASGCGFLPEEDERLDPPIKEARLVEYKTMTVERMDISKSITLFAQWKAAERIPYSFTEYNAPFLEYKVEKGDSVEPGDILAVLDIGEIDNQLRDMEITYQKQKLSYERTFERYEAGQLSEFDLRIAELLFEDVTNKYNDLKTKKAGSLLIADVSGTVFAMMDYEKDQEVNTGVNLITLVRNDDLILQGNSSQIRNSSAKTGYRIVIGSGDVEIEGVISNISGTTVTIEPEYLLDEWELGSTVKAVIPLESAENVLVIDRQAVRTAGSLNYVRVLVDGIALEKNVTLGLESGKYIEITSGLEEGELVIIN